MPVDHMVRVCQALGSSPVLYKLGIVAHTCNPSTGDVEPGRSVQSHLSYTGNSKPAWLHKTLAQKVITKCEERAGAKGLRQQAAGKLQRGEDGSPGLQGLHGSKISL